MKSILISIKPQWVEKILNGEKTIEIRKSMPKCELPYKVYIYCAKSQKKLLTIFRKDDLIWSDDKDEQRFDKTIFVKDDYFSIADERHRWLGKVVAEFTLNKVEELENTVLPTIPTCVYLTKTKRYASAVEKASCLSQDEIYTYLSGRNGYAWYIDDLKIYDKPKELSEFSSITKRMKGKESRFTSHLLQRPPQSWCYVEEIEV